AIVNHNGFFPGDTPRFTQLPDPSTRNRYSDEQLYALALYLYSRQPPKNPNAFDDIAMRGQRVFQREACATCHTPPLYTSNKLTPVDGFTIPADHRQKYDILPVSVGTDPDLALRTRLAPAITKCRRSKAYGIARCSGTTAGVRRSRTGSIRAACATTTCRQDGSRTIGRPSP